jgi:glycosyltransferase involved in cell wall biosynthesis
MRICFLADGQSIHTKRWCAHFAKQGHDIHLITFREAKIESATVHFLNSGKVAVEGGNWKVLLKVGEIKKILAEIKPDILHALYATSYGIAGALTGFHPYIVTALGSDVLISPQNSFIYRVLVKYALKKADWVTAMADHMKEAMIKMGISSQKISTIMFGIDPLIFNHNNRNISEEKFIITSTRNFEPVYNIELLLNALKIVNEKIPNLSVNLIGEGTLRGQLEKTAADMGLKDKIIFHGKLPQTEIAKTLNNTHLFATTSFSDGNNVSLTEAMACGTVSVATDIPANRQWIENGVNGFLVPTDKPEILADKILYVYKNYAELEKKCIPFNDRVIFEKALWTTNMEIVEKKYRELSKTKSI